MTTTHRFHLASAVLGAASLCLVFLVSSAASSAPDRPIEVYGIPKAANIVRLTSADLPYTVPANKSLVITGWVGRIPFTTAMLDLHIDGQAIAYLSNDAGGGTASGSRGLVPGIVATAGSIVSNELPGYPAGIKDGVILGYLAPQ